MTASALANNRENRYDEGMSDESKKVMSYLIGQNLSRMLPQMVPGVEAEDLVAECIGLGILDAMQQKVDPAFINDKVEEHQNTFIRMIQDREDSKADANLEAGNIFLKENAKKPGVTITDSGLQYEIIKAGDGESYDFSKHGDSPTAEVMYKGMLIDGTVFDASKKPVKFNIRQVIPGFTEALKLMPVGSKWRVSIPADLGYGRRAPGIIGPNATLIFEMELISLKK